MSAAVSCPENRFTVNRFTAIGGAGKAKFLGGMSHGGAGDVNAVTMFAKSASCRRKTAPSDAETKTS
jgi:hypothetical protein